MRGRFETYSTLAVAVAALGYFVDIYDITLFNVVRISSLTQLGLRGDELLSTGILLLNVQMAGMLLGGIFWGVLADRRGRVSVLFGSILIYSIANIANAFVHEVATYALWRFIAGVGLSGELGVGVTLVTELLSAAKRGYGTTVIASVGLAGAIVAGLVGGLLDWRTAYIVGGGMGLVLLLMRLGVHESRVYSNQRRSAVARGHFLKLLARGTRVRRYLAVILVGVPIWYLVAIPVGLCPEIGAAMGMTEKPTVAKAVSILFGATVFGNLFAGILSQMVKSRKKVLASFIVIMGLGLAGYFLVGGKSPTAFYACIAVLGIAGGYWTLFATIGSEQFGTNLRATAATTAPNFVRGAVIPLTLTFKLLKGPTGVVGSAVLVGAVVLCAALLAIRSLEETYGKEVDFVEE